MDIGTMLTVVTGLAGVAGGFIGGRRTSNAQAMSIAADTVDMLQAQVDLLTEDKRRNDALVEDLRHRVDVLESMITQRADVEAVRQEVVGIRDVVERIAVEVGA